jgi:hypothetical protein
MKGVDRMVKDPGARAAEPEREPDSGNQIRVKPKFGQRLHGEPQKLD